MLELLRAMSVPDGLAEAVDAAIASYAGQTRKTTRQSRRRSIDERLKRLGELFELGDIPKGEYLSKRNDLQMERDQLEVQPVAASVALQRQRIQSIVDDWAVMTDEEKSRLLQLIFKEIEADHGDSGLALSYKVRPEWQPYVDAVLARRRLEEQAAPAVVTPERKTGLEPATLTLAR